MTYMSCFVRQAMPHPWLLQLLPDMGCHAAVQPLIILVFMLPSSSISVVDAMSLPHCIIVIRNCDVHSCCYVMQAAARAAERRARDNVWCPCGDHGTDVQYTDGQVIPVDNQQCTRSTAAAEQTTGKQQLPHGPPLPVVDRHTQPQVPGKPKQKASRGQHTTPASSAVQLLRQDMQAMFPATRPEASHLAAGGLAQSAVAAAELVDLTEDDADASTEQAVLPMTNKRPRHTSPRSGEPNQMQQPAASQGTKQATAEQPQQASVSWVSAQGAIQPQRNPVVPLVAAATSAAMLQAIPSNALPATSFDAAGKRTWQTSPPEQWACNACTLLNAAMNLQCAACGGRRLASFALPPAHSGAVCNQPMYNRAQASDKMQKQPGGWRCSQCTAANNDKASHCHICQTWRYSYGVPHASRPTL